MQPYEPSYNTQCRITPMAKYAKQASIQQTILIAYILITTPALVLAYFTIQSINDDLAMHAEFLATGTVNPEAKPAKQLARIGKYLRDKSFPFSQTKHDSVFDKTKPLHNWADNLRSERVAILYLWAALISIGLLVYLSLAKNLHVVYRRLIVAIDNLTEHKLNKEIAIESALALPEVSQSLENLRLQLSKDEQQQQKFLRHISHEIKTPLTSIKEGSKLLDQDVMGKMNSEQKEIASILVRSTIELQNAIETLLDYNAAIGFKTDNLKSRVALSSLVKNALESNELAIKQKDLKVDQRLSECDAVVNRRQITAVFDNLLSNAIKHSQTGGQINISLAKKTPEVFCFEISDNGPGVHSEDRDYIFDPFYVGAQASEMPLKGTGLGLSIAKQYVDDHKGEIELLDSKSGASFRVCIPII